LDNKLRNPADLNLFLRIFSERNHIREFPFFDRPDFISKSQNPRIADQRSLQDFLLFDILIKLAFIRSEYRQATLACQLNIAKKMCVADACRYA